MTGLHAVVDPALGNTSYLLEVGGGGALVVDPPRDVDEVLARASDAKLRVIAVLETHVHADFVSGARELMHRTGAPLYAARDAALAFDHHAVSPGDLLAIGNAEIEVVPTPGHTPEHVSFLARLADETLVFTGGSLIVGGAARTDLTSEARTIELARAQHASINRLLALPDATVVAPTHGGGSFCSTGPARSATSTIGDERATNPLARAPDAAAFVQMLLAGLGSYPRYFRSLPEMNRKGAPLLEDLPPVPRIGADAATDAVARGAWLIDGRPWRTWARAHPAGAISIAVREAFASWLGWIVPFGEPVVLVLEPEQVADAVRFARRIGYDGLEGWTTFDDWRASGAPVGSVTIVSATEAAAGKAVMVDVRQRAEFEASHIEGARHIEVGDFATGPLPNEPIVGYCVHGERSATAVSFLARAGVDVAVLDGGIEAWRRAGLPITP